MARLETDVAFQLQEVIRKNLPAQVGEEMRKYLDQAKRNEDELDRANKRMAELRDKAISLEQDVMRQAADLAKHVDLDKREAEILKRENVWEVTKARLERDEAVKRSDDVLQLVGTLVKNPVFKKTRFGDSYTDDKGQYHGGTETEIKETE